jgi:hypothetical protein
VLVRAVKAGEAFPQSSAESCDLLVVCVERHPSNSAKSAPISAILQFRQVGARSRLRCLRLALHQGAQSPALRTFQFRQFGAEIWSAMESFVQPQLPEIAGEMRNVLEIVVNSSALRLR